MTSTVSSPGGPTGHATPLVALVVAAAGCLSPTLEFSAEPVPDLLAAPAPHDYVESGGWAEGTLVVRALVRGGCDVKRVEGSFSADEDLVRLSFRTVRGAAAARCEHAHRLTFSVKRLPPRPYTVVLVDEEGEADRLVLHQDGTVADACDGDTTYACYADVLRPNARLPRGSRVRPGLQPRLVFDSPFHEYTARRTPDLGRALVRNELSVDPLCRAWEFRLRDRDPDMPGSLKTLGYRGCGVNGDLAVAGSSFDEIVRRYLEREKVRSAPRSPAGALSQRLALPVSYLQPNQRGMRVEVAGETVAYASTGGGGQATVTLVDRPGLLRIAFPEGGVSVTEVTRDQLLTWVDVAQDVYDLLRADGRFDLPGLVTTIQLEPSLERGSFEAEARTDPPTVTSRLLVHNHSLPQETRLRQRFQVRRTERQVVVAPL
jgi:hypothetical protein